MQSITSTQEFHLNTWGYDLTHKSLAFPNKTIQHHHFDISKYSPQHMRINLLHRIISHSWVKPKNSIPSSWIQLKLPTSTHEAQSWLHTRLTWRMTRDVVTLTLPLSEGIILCHSKLVSEVPILHHRQRLRYPICYLLISTNVLRHFFGPCL